MPRSSGPDRPDGLLLGNIGGVNLVEVVVALPGHIRNKSRVTLLKNESHVAEVQQAWPRVFWYLTNANSMNPLGTRLNSTSGICRLLKRLLPAREGKTQKRKTNAPQEQVLHS
jgi:hypothetical protein